MKKTLFLVSIATLLSFVMQDANAQQPFERTVLIEQFTTVNCGWCPSGADRITQAVEGRNDVIWIKHHAGFGTDFLTNSIHTTMTAFYGGSTFAPAMMVDRTRFDESDPGPVTSIASTYLGIRNLINKSKRIETYCLLNPIDVSFDGSTRKITGEVTGRFSSEVWNENTRLTVFVIEDSIVGEQHDYTSHGNWTDYVHMGTVRAAITDKWGDAIEVNEDMTFSYTIDYTLPSSYDFNHCKVVAFVYNYDASNINNCSILNAGQSKMFNEVLGIDASASRIATRLYPNPSKGRVVVEAEEEIVSIVVANSIGQTVLVAKPEETHAIINTTGLPAGLYLVRIQTQRGIATQKVVVE